jgi:hypothetical protein
MHQTLVALALLAVAVTPLGAQPFTVAASAWDSEVYGNHRAVVDVTAPGRFALASVAWRRPDRNPNSKGVIVVAARTNRRVTNVLRRSTTQALGEFAFEPIDGPGRYYLYYLPYKSGGRSNYPNVTYLADTATADQAWLGALRDTAIAPAARVLRFEAVDSLNAFAPMQVIATPSEVALLRGQHQRQPFLVFPRTGCIRFACATNCRSGGRCAARPRPSAIRRAAVSFWPFSWACTRCSRCAT